MAQGRNHLDSVSKNFRSHTWWIWKQKMVKSNDCVERGEKDVHWEGEKGNRKRRPKVLFEKERQRARRRNVQKRVERSDIKVWRGWFHPRFTHLKSRAKNRPFPPDGCLLNLPLSLSVRLTVSLSISNFFGFKNLLTLKIELKCSIFEQKCLTFEF